LKKTAAPQLSEATLCAAVLCPEARRSKVRAVGMMPTQEIFKEAKAPPPKKARDE